MAWGTACSVCSKQPAAPPAPTPNPSSSSNQMQSAYGGLDKGKGLAGIGAGSNYGGGGNFLGTTGNVGVSMREHFYISRNNGQIGMQDNPRGGITTGSHVTNARILDIQPRNALWVTVLSVVKILILLTSVLGLNK